MGKRIGRDRLSEKLLAGTPDRVLDTLVSGSPEDAADLRNLREELSLLALVPAPARPRPALRERLLATRPRPRGPRRPAVLVIDMLNDHLTPGRPIEIPRARAIVPALKARLAEARARDVPIIYACDAHPPDDPEFRDWPLHDVEGTEGAEIWPELTPAPGDRIIRKRTYSAFCGTELGSLLDDLGTDQLVITGCATEVGIAATAMDALQRGFVVSVPPDCQAGGSELAEQITLGTLGVLVPFEPRYLRGRAGAEGALGAEQPES